MSSNEIYKVDLTPSDLNGAMSSLTEKMRDFSSSLSDKERSVFQGVIKSASDQMEAVEESDLGEDLPYAKPVQSHVHASVREQIIGLKNSIKV